MHEDRECWCAENHRRLPIDRARDLYLEINDPQLYAEKALPIMMKEYPQFTRKQHLDGLESIIKLFALVKEWETDGKLKDGKIVEEKWK